MFVYSLISFILAILGVGILGLFFIIAICSIVYTFYSLIFNGRDKNNKDSMNNKSVQLKSLAYKNRLHNDSHLRREIALFKAGELIVRHKLGFDMAHCCNIEDLSFIDSNTDYELSNFSSMKSATDMLVLLYSGLCGEYLGNDRKDSVSFISQNNLTGATNLVKNIIKHNYVNILQHIVI